MKPIIVPLVLLSTPLAAQIAPDYAQVQLPDAAQEHKAKLLMETIRCVVCQGQSIADSDANIAADMRALIRERIAAGEKPEDIRSWLIDHYGQWVSYQPVFEPATMLLWILPLFALFLGAYLALGMFKRRAK